MRLLTTLLILLFAVNGFSQQHHKKCHKDKTPPTEEQIKEANLREDSRISAILFKSEKGAYSGQNYLFPIYNYKYNTKKDYKKFSAILNLIYCKKSGNYSKHKLLWGLGSWSIEKKCDKGQYIHKSVGPLGLLWYELQTKNVKTKNILWGLLWRHRVKADVETKSFTPLLSFTKNNKTGKKRVNLLWFISFSTN